MTPTLCVIFTSTAYERVATCTWSILVSFPRTTVVVIVVCEANGLRFSSLAISR